MTIIEVNALAQSSRLIADAVKSISNRIDKSTEGLLLVAFNCEKDTNSKANNVYKINAVIYNNSGNHISNFDICIEANGELKSIINSGFITKDSYIQTDLFKVQIFLDGTVKISSLNGKYYMDAVEKIWFIVDDNQYDVEVDLLEIVHKII